MDELEGIKVPRHLAVIMDGNGRWAQARGWPRIKGHAEGANSVREVVRACRELGVEAVTLYSFSTENWRRPATEVAGLMKLLADYLRTERREILDNNIRLNAVGEIDRLPRFVRKPLEEMMKISNRGPTRMTLTLALSYGGRQEIVEAMQAIAKKVSTGRMPISAIDEETISSHLYTAGLPDPDLLIRTSGEMRISNFLLWQLAYAELYITETAWPEFRRPQLLEAFREYARRERRFGKTGAQVKGEKT